MDREYSKEMRNAYSISVGRPGSYSAANTETPALYMTNNILFSHFVLYLSTNLH
jgi:hypothetical protein